MTAASDFNATPNKQPGESTQPQVYVAMSADLVHPGHLNVLREAATYGEVIVGLLTDSAIASYKRLPFMSFAQRKEVVSSLNDLRGLVKLELLNMRHNHLENEKNFQRKAEECLKGTGLRFFKEERIFASSKRNLKSSVLLTSAREGKDGSGLWHSCVEF